MIIMHKPWYNVKTDNVLLEDRRKSIRAFNEMVSNNELPTYVDAQYILAVNYIDKRRIKIVARGGIT